jgi:hypothetical protein
LAVILRSEATKDLLLARASTARSIFNALDTFSALLERSMFNPSVKTAWGTDILFDASSFW